MENMSLIEISSEDDLLIPSSSQKFGIHTGCTLEAEKIEKVRKNLEEVPHLLDSPEQNQKVSDRYNLRKSLAWDSAFFTGEGILNPEELATMNNTHSKVGITLPGIQELRKSSESTSTIESDNWALEHLELNLFDNVQDSIQRSLGSSNHTSNMVHYDKIKEQKKQDVPNVRILKKINDSSEIKLKLPTALRRHDVGWLKTTYGNVESKPLIRQPKVSSKTIPLPASVPGKKSSIGIKESKGSLSQSFIDNRTKSYINGDCGSRLPRPSGLRIPRPTIGYFDKEKTLVRGSNKTSKASLQNHLMKNASVNYTGSTNKVEPIDLPTVRDRGLPSALSKQVSNSAKVNSLTKIENHKKLCPKVDKIISETVEHNCKINFKNERVPTDQVEKVQSCNSSKKKEPSLLRPNVFARENENENETIGEQKTHYQSYRKHNQQEKEKNGLKSSDRETEKENVCHDLKTEHPSKMHKMEVIIGGEDVLSFTI